MPPSVTICAFAKINLSLSITGTRPDGFHELRTIFQAVDLFDRLICSSRRGPFEIACRAANVPRDRTNLVWRAAQMLWAVSGRDGEPRDTHILIEKSIPMRAGLGGGSSDAAAALLGLRRLWTLSVTDEQLHAIAGRLGSDVGYFLVGGTALGLGRGEEVYPLADVPRWRAVLVFPPFGIATADAYAWFDEDRSTASRPADVRPCALPDTWLGRVVPLVNDLEAPVVRRHPSIGALCERLSTLGATLSGMSGSGSTVFGIFRTSGEATKALRSLRRTGANGVCVRLLDRKQTGRV